jgi:hypothetical protein
VRTTANIGSSLLVRMVFPRAFSARHPGSRGKRAAYGSGYGLST